MELKHIIFIFENSDNIKIEGSCIGNFLVTDIETSIKRVAGNSIAKIDTANTILIKILKEANVERYEFDQRHIEDYRQMTFDRLQNYGDITSIQFELTEHETDEKVSPRTESYHYYVNWTGNSRYENSAQKCYLNKDGDLFILIAEGKHFGDFSLPA